MVTVDCEAGFSGMGCWQPNTINNKKGKKYLRIIKLLDVLTQKSLVRKNTANRFIVRQFGGSSIFNRLIFEYSLNVHNLAAIITNQQPQKWQQEVDLTVGSDL